MRREKSLVGCYRHRPGKPASPFRRWHGCAVIKSAAERVLVIEFVARVQRDSMRENVAIDREATPFKMRSPALSGRTGPNHKG